jgi:hypothetical protein
MNQLAGFILVLYGMIGTYRATELLHRNRLPVAACGALALLGIMIALGGIGLALGTPAALLLIVLLVARRGLLVYIQRKLHGRIRGRDIWPAAWPEAALTLLLIVGSA